MTDTECTRLCKALSVRIDAVEHMAEEREERNKERFASREEALRLSQEASKQATIAAHDSIIAANEQSKEAAQKLSEIYERRHRQLEESLSAVSDRFMPKEVYTVQHTQLAKQIEINTGRLYEIEKFIASFREIKQEKTHQVSTTYQVVATSGVLFAVITSLVTVVFNTIVYLRH